MTAILLKTAALVFVLRADPAAEPMSCVAKAGDSCTELSGSAVHGQQQARLKQGCIYSRGTLAQRPCPAANRVGSCTYPKDSGVAGAKLVFYPPTTAAQAAKLCAGERGVFVAGQ